MTGLERYQLALLPAGLGLDPPPVAAEPKTRRKAAVA
jgi:hypothetical protein